MGRIMAIDYGTRRVGIAVTDPHQIIATPLDTITPEHLYTYLKQYTSTESVDQIVVGYPLKEDGSPTDLTKPVVNLLDQLRNRFPHIKVTKQDERYTSKLAKQSMIAGGFSKSARRKKANLDKISATLILQSYLEEKKVTS